MSEENLEHNSVIRDVSVNVVEEKEVMLEEVEKSIENIRDDVEKKVEDLLTVTFLQLFENFLKEDLSKFNIKLTPEIQQYFSILCKEQPDLFGDFEKSLKQIILDDKIDTKDIPEIILLVSKVHKVLIAKHTRPIVDHYELIKTLLNLVFVVYIQTNKMENKQLIEDLIKIIDVSIDLVKLSPLKKNMKSCLFKCF
jgi:hypothetical protein